MKKKVLLKGPLLTRSGYGEQARFALRSLRSREDLFDVFIQPLQWVRLHGLPRWMKSASGLTRLLRRQLVIFSREVSSTFLYK